MASMSEVVFKVLMIFHSSLLTYTFYFSSMNLLSLFSGNENPQVESQCMQVSLTSAWFLLPVLLRTGRAAVHRYLPKWLLFFFSTAKAFEVIFSALASCRLSKLKVFSCCSLSLPSPWFFF